MSWNRVSKVSGIIVSTAIAAFMIVYSTTFVPGLGTSYVEEHNDELTPVPTPPNIAAVIHQEAVVLSAGTDSVVVLGDLANLIREQFAESGEWPQIKWIQRSITNHAPLGGVPWRTSWIDQLVIGDVEISTRLYKV